MIGSAFNRPDTPPLPISPLRFVSGQMTEDAYASLVNTENMNRAPEDELGARNVVEALSALGVRETAEADKHPEK